MATASFSPSSKNISIPVIPFTKYQKLAIVILALLQFTIVLDFMIIAPLGYIMTKELTMSPSQFANAVSAYAFSAGASGFLAATFADRFDRKKILLFFYIGFIVGTTLCGLSNSYNTLLFARIITGIFGGVIGSISTAIVADIFTFNQRGRVMGFIMMSFSVSQILGLPVGISIANHFCWEATFYMIVGVSILILLLIIFKLRPINEHLKNRVGNKNPFMHLWNTATKKEYVIGFLSIGLMSLGGFMLMPFTTIFTVNNLGITQDKLPLIYTCVGIATMIFMPIIGRISDKVDKFKLCAITSLSCIGVVIFYTTLSHHVSLIEYIIINMVLFASIMGKIVPIQSLSTGIPVAEDRGAYMSISASVQQVAGGIGAVIAGYVVVQKTPHDPIEHFDTLGYVHGVSLLIAIYFAYRMAIIIQHKIKNNTL